MPIYIYIFLTITFASDLQHHNFPFFPRSTCSCNSLRGVIDPISKFALHLNGTSQTQFTKLCTKLINYLAIIKDNLTIRNEFVFGEKVNLIFNNVSGLNNSDGKTFPELSMYIVKNEDYYYYQ